MKKLIAFLIMGLLLSSSAFAFAKRPEASGGTVNVFVNNSTSKNEAHWACRNANFKKASTLDASGNIVPGTTDYAKMDELNKACPSPV